MTLTPDERRDRASVLLELQTARATMEAAYQRLNATVRAAYAECAVEVAAYNATLKRASAFCERVAEAREDFDGPLPYGAELTRDMGDRWREGAEELGQLTAALDPVREYSFVGDGEPDPREVLLDLPTETP